MPPLTHAQWSRGSRWLLAHYASNTAFLYLTIIGSVFMLYMDELHLSKTQTGFLVAIVPFFSVITLFIAGPVARLGWKRVYVTCWTLRKIAIAFLIPLPWLVAPFGKELSFIYIAVVIGLFSLCRSTGEAAFYPWYKEIVPDQVRGRFTASTQIWTTGVGALTMLFASLVLSISDQLWRFSILMTVGVISGLFSAYAASRVPGVDLPADSAAHKTRFTDTLQPLRDRGMLLYLLACALLLLAGGSLGTFLPLFMREIVGLPDRDVVLIDVAIMFGGVVGSLPWGWLADRVGSKPVMLAGLALMLLLPLGLLVMPRGAHLIFPVFLLFIHNVVAGGWAIGGSRILYNTLLPKTGVTPYTALYAAWIGLFSGLSALGGGWALEWSRHSHFTLPHLTTNDYTPLILFYPAALLAAWLLLSRLRVTGEMSTLNFASTLLRVDLLETFRSVMSHNQAGDELRRVLTTVQLGDAKTVLNADELIESLSDPSFNVRFEAAISMARTQPDGRLTAALIKQLQSDEPDMIVIAAWALGRLGDRHAAPALRQALAEGRPMVAARCARALAMLGDQESVPLLLARMRDETDEATRVSFAAAIAALGSTAATAELLAFLADARSEAIRHELTLALARIAGNENMMIREWRRVRREGLAALLADLERVQRRLHSRWPARLDLHAAMTRLLTHFAAEPQTTLDQPLADVLTQLPQQDLSEPQQIIITHCLRRLIAHEPTRPEYLLLALVVLDAAAAQT